MRRQRSLIKEFVLQKHTGQTSVLEIHKAISFSKPHPDSSAHRPADGNTREPARHPSALSLNVKEKMKTSSLPQRETGTFANSLKTLPAQVPSGTGGPRLPLARASWKAAL